MDVVVGFEYRIIEVKKGPYVSHGDKDIEWDEQNVDHY